MFSQIIQFYFFYSVDLVIDYSLYFEYTWISPLTYIVICLPSLFRNLKSFKDIPHNIIKKKFINYIILYFLFLFFRTGRTIINFGYIYCFYVDF